MVTEHQQEQQQSQPTRFSKSMMINLATLGVVLVVGVVVIIVMVPSSQQSQSQSLQSPENIGNDDGMMAEATTTAIPLTTTYTPTMIFSTPLPTPMPTTSTSTAPSDSPTTIMMNLAITILSPYIPDLQASPMQEEALEWLVRHDVEEATLSDAGNAGRLLDRFALAMLYLATDGDDWEENDDWLSDNSVCDWWINSSYKICAEDDGRVGRISLLNNNLGGTIPTEIGLLTELTYLDLESNQLEGTIPTEIGLLTGLTHLGLDENQLEGTIPTEIGLLTELIKLDLDTNKIEGTIPTELVRLTSLTYLYLDDNDLSGDIPSELYDFLDNLFDCWLVAGTNPDLDGVPPNCE